MHRATVLALFLTIFVGAVSIDRLAAQPPDRLTKYRFLPRHSILHVQGGFAGFEACGVYDGRRGREFRAGANERLVHMKSSQLSQVS